MKLDLKTRCNTAEDIEAELARLGIAPRSRPWTRLANLLAPLTSTLPMEQAPTRQARQADRAMMGFMLLVAVPLFLVALPFELVWDARARRHNRRLRAHLGLDGKRQAGLTPYRAAAGPLARTVGPEELRSAESIWVVNFRTNTPAGRFALAGTAVVASSGQERRFAYVAGYRSRRQAVHGEHGELAEDLARLYGTEVREMHWEWAQGDPFELDVRDLKPW